MKKAARGGRPEIEVYPGGSPDPMPQPKNIECVPVSVFPAVGPNSTSII